MLHEKSEGLGKRKRDVIERKGVWGVVFSKPYSEKTHLSGSNTFQCDLEFETRKQKKRVGYLLLFGQSGQSLIITWNSEESRGT